MEGIVEIINTTGFPIAVCIGFAMFINKIIQQNTEQQREDKDKLYKELEANRTDRLHFLETLNKFNIRFEGIESKLDSLAGIITRKSKE